MIVDFETSNHAMPSFRPQRSDAQFSTLMAQFAAPLFSPWPAADMAARTGFTPNSASLSTHPASSNRREGRHERE